MTDDPLPLTKKTTLQDRRTEKRHPSGNYKAIVTIKPLFDKKKHIIVKVINISTKGVRFSSKYNFSTKTKIILSFKIQEGDTWKVPSKIVNTYDNLEYGVFFDTPQTDLLNQLLKFEQDSASS